MKLKPSEVEPGNRIRLPGSETVYEVMAEPRAYSHGQAGDVIIKVRWSGDLGERQEELAFQGRVHVHRVWR